MNIKYHPWITFEVINDYFPQGICPVIELIPSESTALILKNYEILINRTDNKHVLYVGIDAAEMFDPGTLFTDIEDLYFRVLATDFRFAMYSEIPSFSDVQLFSFGNGLNTENANVLQHSEFVSEADLMPVKPSQFSVEIPEGNVSLQVTDDSGTVVSEIDLEDNTNSRYPVKLPIHSEGIFKLSINGNLKETFMVVPGDIPENILGVLRFDVAKHLEDPSNENTYSLSFEVRSVFRTYTIIVPESRKIEIVEMDVLDPDGNSYDGPEEQVLMGQPARVFTSPGKLPLQQVQEKGPQLAVQYTNELSTSAIPLEMDLPNPEPESIQKYLQGEHAGAYFSSTIVYV